MPELPEVEVTRLGLLPGLTGHRVTHIFSSGKKLRLPVPGKLLAEHILGRTFLAVDRRAKYLLFRLSGGATMVIHLGMTGKLSLIPSQRTLARHDHLRLRLDDDMELRLNDCRRFGSVMVWPPSEAAEREAVFSARAGIEPFSIDFNPAFLRRLAGSRKTPVKNMLMDSRILAGIGNIYANEILFAAGIHPQLPAGSITTGQWKAIITATRSLLTQAIQAGGSTISDFLGASGHPGYFQLRFKVYNRTGKKCKYCRDIIRKTIIGGRATFHCPTCQPLLNSVGPSCLSERG